MTADEIIERLGLLPHPEGGWYAETWRADAVQGERPSGSAIYFLLRAGERSRWHRVDAAEAWHFYAGDPLELCIAEDGSPARIKPGPHGAPRPRAAEPPGARIGSVRRGVAGPTH
jgi:predicted cupin superfamily sugar epimerase